MSIGTNMHLTQMRRASAAQKMTACALPIKFMRVCDNCMRDRRIRRDPVCSVSKTKELLLLTEADLKSVPTVVVRSPYFKKEDAMLRVNLSPKPRTKPQPSQPSSPLPVHAWSSDCRLCVYDLVCPISATCTAATCTALFDLTMTLRSSSCCLTPSKLQWPNGSRPRGWSKSSKNASPR